MIKNQDWKAIVPKETADYIKKINGVRRVKRINSKSK
jgi:nicotinamide mononucleotide adenylyltransferase